MINDTKSQTAPHQQESSATNPGAGNLGLPLKPWLAHLMDDKVSSKKFVQGLKTRPIPIPDKSAQNEFANAVIATPVRVKRLLSLMRESIRANETIERVVFDLAESSIRHIEALSVPVVLDSVNYPSAVSAWLEGLPKKPIKASDLTVLHLLIRYGLRRRLMDDESAFGLLAAAVRPPPTRVRKQADSPKPVPTPMDVVLAAGSVAPVLAALIAHSEAWKAQTDAQLRLVQMQQTEISRLSRICTESANLIEELRRAQAALEDANTAATVKIGELEKQMLDLSDGWQHKLDELRGRIRGMMTGQLTRWVQTALDAARTDPPFAKVIEERLEDTLKLIERELKWLQPSD